MIVIVDYGMGNPGSIANMFRKVGTRAVVSADSAVIEAATKLVLPGVGAFDAGMANLEGRDLVELLTRRAMRDRVPTLGICLGMQLMTRRSEEGSHPGLGWVDAEALRFSFSDVKLKVPHMGWNSVDLRKESPLFAGLDQDARFYFVHSYFVRCANPADVLMTADYGGEFHAAIQAGNVVGVQFHPEKSHKFGMRLLANFADWS